MRQHSLRLDDDLIEAVDSMRGLVPRNAWIVDVLRRATAPGVSERSPGPEFENGALRERVVPADSELERRRKVAAGHKAGCGCLNCDYVRSHDG